MTARVLIVDDLLANLKLIEARLSAEYFEVSTATNGADALALCASGKCDIVLLDVMMPGMDGLEVCRRLKGNKATAHITVVMVTALDQPSSLLHGFEAGADDFLAKPIDELALLALVKSLSRSRFALDELRSQALRSVNLGIGFPLSRAMASDGSGGRIMVAEDSPASAELIANALRRFHDVECIHDQDRVLDSAALGNYDLFIVSVVIIMPGTSLHTGFGIAEEIRAATASETFTLTPGGHEIPVTVSAGLAESANDSQSGLLRRADMALYRSKQGGRDRVCVDCAGAAVQARMAGCL